MLARAVRIEEHTVYSLKLGLSNSHPKREFVFDAADPLAAVMGRAPNRRDLSATPGPKPPTVGTAGKDIVRNPAPSRKQSQQEPVLSVIDKATGLGESNRLLRALCSLRQLLRSALPCCRGSCVLFASCMHAAQPLRTLALCIQEASLASCPPSRCSDRWPET